MFVDYDQVSTDFEEVKAKMFHISNSSNIKKCLSDVALSQEKQNYFYAHIYSLNHIFDKLVRALSFFCCQNPSLHKNEFSSTEGIIIEIEGQ